MANSPALIPELMVSNYAQSLAFYTQLAGFKVVYDRHEESFAMLGGPCAYSRFNVRLLRCFVKSVLL